MLVFIDANYKCHVVDDGTMRAFEVPFFDNKAPAVIEGYNYVPPGETRIGVDGTAFQGEQRSPWRDLALLEEFQAQYEAQLAAAAAAYAEGVNSI